MGEHSSQLIGILPFANAAVVWSLIGIVLLGLMLLIWLMPRLLVRIPIWLLTHTIYRLRFMGVQNVPEKGGALVVCNHVTDLDWRSGALATASCCVMMELFSMTVRHRDCPKIAFS